MEKKFSSITIVVMDKTANGPLKFLPFVIGENSNRFLSQPLKHLLILFVCITTTIIMMLLVALLRFFLFENTALHANDLLTEMRRMTHIATTDVEYAALLTQVGVLAYRNSFIFQENVKIVAKFSNLNGAGIDILRMVHVI
jgi:hypothetical protein